MAFPASQITLRSALDSAMGTAARAKTLVANSRNASAAGSVTRSSILLVAANLTAAIAAWDAAAGVAGIGAYAQSQFGNASLDIATEFSNMRAAAVTLRDWIVANFPKDVSGAALLYAIDAGGNTTEMTFTSAQLAQFRTQADSFLATIA